MGDKNRIVLAWPRSSCAGVERAVEIVERALAIFGPPVWVRRHIVHNSHVVERLEGLGAVFVEELDEVPPGSIAIFSAHGVSPAVREQAMRRNLRVIDATCPLVAKVHAEARRFARQKRQVILVGHRGHDEVEGTLGEVPGTLVVESVADVDALDLPSDTPVALLNQTTLSAADVSEVARAVRERFADTLEPASSDICYATQNRQQAVATVAAQVDVVLVVGSPTSSNSCRLVEVASRAGARAHLVDSAREVDPAWIEGAKSVGVSSGASTPEHVVDEVVQTLAAHIGGAQVEELRVVEEKVSFKLPAELREEGVSWL